MSTNPDTAKRQRQVDNLQKQIDLDTRRDQIQSDLADFVSTMKDGGFEWYRVGEYKHPDTGVLYRTSYAGHEWDILITYPNRTKPALFRYSLHPGTTPEVPMATVATSIALGETSYSHKQSDLGSPVEEVARQSPCEKYPHHGCGCSLDD